MSMELSRLSFNGGHVTQVKYNGVVVGNYSPLITVTITASGSVSAQNLQAGEAHIALTSDQEYVSSRGGSYRYWKRYIGEVTIPASGSVTAQVGYRIPQTHTFTAKGTYNIAVTVTAMDGTDDDYERNATYTLTVTGDSASAAALQSLYLLLGGGSSNVRECTRITSLPYSITTTESLCSGEGTGDRLLLLTATQYHAMDNASAWVDEHYEYGSLGFVDGYDFGSLTVGETKTQTISCNQTVTEEIPQGVYFEKQ